MLEFNVQPMLALESMMLALRSPGAWRPVSRVKRLVDAAVAC